MSNHAISFSLLQMDHDYKKLAERHQSLEHEIERLRQHPSTDFVVLTQLKRQKLLLRDRMARLERRTMH